MSRWRAGLAPLVLLAAGAGCVAPESLGSRFGLDTTLRIAIVHSRAFAESGTLEDVAEGKIHWLDEPAEVREFVLALEGKEVESVAGRRALTLLFVPEDAYSRKQIDLDENLDVFPGCVQYGEPAGTPPFETTTEFKVRLIATLGQCAECRAYLGIPSRTAGSSDPKPAPAPPPAE